MLNILELEIGLTNKDVDLVVHSLKDLPSTLPEDMVIGAIMERVDPRDSVIMKNCRLDPLQSNQTAVQRPKTLNDLPKGSILGTSAVRRGAQLRASYPNIYTVFSMHSPSLQGSFQFSYSRGHGVCNYPKSSISQCSDASKLVFRYQVCNFLLFLFSLYR